MMKEPFKHPYSIAVAVAIVVGLCIALYLAPVTTNAGQIFVVGGTFALAALIPTMLIAYLVIAVQKLSAERERPTRLVQARAAEQAPSVAVHRRSLSDRPVLKAAMLGSIGSIIGVLGSVVAGWLFILVVSFFGDPLPGMDLPPDYEEVLSYLVALYCLVMFPCGGVIVGAIPGALVGIRWRDRPKDLRPVPPVLSGLLIQVILTVGAVFAAIVASADR